MDVCTQLCGYWCPGAKAPGHQYPQCWCDIHCIGPVSWQSITFIENTRKWNDIKNDLIKPFLIKLHFEKRYDQSTSPWITFWQKILRLAHFSSTTFDKKYMTQSAHFSLNLIRWVWSSKHEHLKSCKILQDFVLPFWMACGQQVWFRIIESLRNLGVNVSDFESALSLLMA